MRPRTWATSAQTSWVRIVKTPGFHATSIPQLATVRSAWRNLCCREAMASNSLLLVFTLQHHVSLAVCLQCSGRNELCVAPGPGKDMFESCEIIGSRQAAVAEQLYTTAVAEGTQIDTSAGVDYRHMWVQMPGYIVNDPATGQPVGHLCNASMGQSFAAGTIDGAFSFSDMPPVGSQPASCSDPTQRVLLSRPWYVRLRAGSQFE